MAISKIRITLTNQSMAKLASLVANGALLASNAFMVTAGIRDSLRDNRRQRIRTNLQAGAEIAASLAALTRVISETLEQHRGPGT
ncbi:hypothetical protein ACFL4U_04240 [Candidatus Neomarinimicrobiota bacterium]